jgi:uncharacterized repeat protein (TIGR03943 family)
LFQSIVVVAWIAAFWFLVQRIWGPPLLGKFLRPDYWWLAEMGTAILVIFLISIDYRQSCHRGRRGLSLLVQMIIMILPLVYLPTAAVSQLSPEAAKKRSLYLTQSGYTKQDASRQSTPGSITDETKTAERNLKPSDNPSLLQLASEPELYEGKRVTATGMAYQDQNLKLPENSFFCYRLLMYCCAADARPTGVLVEYDKSKTLQKGTWVKVEGIVGFTTVEDQRLTKITAETVMPTEAPENAYLLP